MSVAPAVEVQSLPEAAFAELYERNVDRIFAFCRRRLRSRQEAEDAVQETFVAAMRAIQRGSVPRCESAWLHKIAENVCFAVYRSSARRHVRDLSDSERIARLAARDGGAESLLGLEEALDGLPLNQRRAFVLRELRGLSYKEIAIQLGVSVASVETLIYRARRGVANGLEAGAGLRRRVTAAVNLGSIVAAAKGWLGGMTAVKVASAATVVAVATLPAGDVAPKSVKASTFSPVPSVERQSVRRAVLWGAPRAPAGPAAAPDRTPRTSPRVTDRPRPVRSGPEPSRPSGPRQDDVAPARISEPVPRVSPAESPAAVPVPSLAPTPHAPPPAPPQVPEVPPALPVSAPALDVPALPAAPQLPVQLPVELPVVGELLPPSSE